MSKQSGCTRVMDEVRSLIRAGAGLFCMLTLSACGVSKLSTSLTSSLLSSGDRRIGFSQVDAALIQPKCVSCHNSSSPGGGINLESYAALMSSGSVIPRLAAASRFYASIQEGSMPIGATVSASQLQMVRDWINAGANLNGIAGGGKGLGLGAALPASGPVSGNTILTLTGSGFDSNLQVLVGGAPCGELVVDSAEQASCVTPAHAAGAVDVAVSAGSGKSSVLSGGFMYRTVTSGAPTITSVSPNSGDSAGGVQITIAGTGFQAGVKVTLDRIGACASMVRLSTTSLNCVVPAHGGGSVSVDVTNTDGQRAALAGGYSYQIKVLYSALYASVIQPKCVSCHSTANPMGQVDLSTYSAMMAAASVIVPGNPGASRLYSSSLASGSPSMPPKGPYLSTIESQAIADWIRAGAISDTGPTVSSISTNAGPVAGGTPMTFIGSNFDSTLKITFGGIPCASIVVASATSASCITPAHAAQAVDVVVTNHDLQTATLLGAYVYRTGGPTISTVAPGTGSIAGGTLLTVTGSGFTSGMVAALGVAATSGDRVACTGVSVLSATSFTCTTGAHSAGLVDLFVTNPDLQSVTKSVAYAYGAPVNVISISPVTGTSDGNLMVTITGSGFVAGATVKIGNSVCSSPNVVSSTTLTCTAPSHAPGSANVVVSNLSGTPGVLGGGYEFTTAPRFSAINTYIFQAKCVGCHGLGSVGGGVNLSSYFNTISTGSVIPQNSGGSTTYTTVRNGSMPKSNQLPASDVAAIRAWIDAGALNN